MVNHVDFRTKAVALPLQAQPPQPAAQDGAFASMLQCVLERSGALRFSAHALERLERRQIELTDADLARVDSALEQAAAKGARDSLLLMDRLALVVNVPNRTVITVLPANEAGHNVFTNIDSAVVVPPATVSPSSTLTTGPAPARGGPGAADRQTRRMV